MIANAIAPVEGLSKAIIASEVLEVGLTVLVWLIVRMGELESVVEPVVGAGNSPGDDSGWLLVVEMRVSVVTVVEIP
jgi:hypothetical protein